MKLIFLVTLFFLASDWPTPSVCWPSLNQQYGAMDSTPLSAILGQQMLSNQLNGYGMNTLMGNGGAGRFNPDLMKMFSSGGSGGVEPRGAFARVGNQAKAKKLSNTKFMLKPVNPVVMHDEPIEEAVEEFEQEFVPARGQRQFQQQQQQPRKLVKRPLVAESPRKANFQRQQQFQQQQQQQQQQHEEEDFEEQHQQEEETIDNLHQVNEEQHAELENLQQTVEQNVAPVLQEQQAAAVIPPAAPVAPLVSAPAVAPAAAAATAPALPETANVAAQNIDQTSSQQQQQVVEDQLLSKIQQHQQEQQQEQVQQEQQQQQVEATPNVDAAFEQQQETQTSADADHPNVKAVQQEIPEVHAPAHATYTAPFAQQQQAASSSSSSSSSTLSTGSSESVRMLNARIPSRNFQQQLTQQQAYDQYFDEEQQQQPLVQQQQQQQQAQARPLRFKVETPDNVHSVGMETIRGEISRELSKRKNPNRVVNTDDEQMDFNPRESTRPLYANTYYNPTTAATGFGPQTTADIQRTNFATLIIIVNSNDNVNLGVSYIDPDMLRSFLSQYAGRSINDVLGDISLEDKIKKFNRDHERSTSTSKTNGKENKSSDKSDSGYESSKKSESTSKLSANVPTYTGAGPDDAHSESTVLLRRQDGGYDTQNLAYNSPYNPNTYSYVPHQNGGLVIINNVNRNWNKRVRSVLSGYGRNISPHNEAFALPLEKKHMERLMKSAIIVANTNTNDNKQ